MTKLVEKHKNLCYYKSCKFLKGVILMKIGYDNDKYIKTQSEQIRKRVNQFGGKLYLEFGGKLFDDHHASRVLPGFQPDSKLKMLLKLKDEAEIVQIAPRKPRAAYFGRADESPRYEDAFLVRRIPVHLQGGDSYRFAR